MIKKAGFQFCFNEQMCRSCKGRCCIGEGYVFLTERDITEISEFLKITEEQFLKLYTRKVNYKVALIDLVVRGEKRCVFLSDEYLCEIYPKRPKQCREFPFWNSLKDKPLESVVQLCPGVVRC